MAGVNKNKIFGIICYYLNCFFSISISPPVYRHFGRLFPLLIFSTVLYVLVENANLLSKNQGVALESAKFPSQIATLPYIVPTFPEILSTVTMTHGLGFFGKLILNCASWSISVEFYAYVLFSCLCFLLRGWMRNVCLALAGLAAFAIVVWASVDLHTCFRTGGCLDISYDFGFARCVSSFFLGALTCCLSRSVRFHSSALQLVGLAVAVAVFSLLDTFPVLTFFCPTMFALLVLSLCRDTGVVAETLKRRPFQVLGQRSYSIYMMHPILLLLMAPVLKRLHGPLQYGVGMVAYVALLVLVSGWTYKYIEDPCRVRFNRFAAA